MKNSRINICLLLLVSFLASYSNFSQAHVYDDCCAPVYDCGDPLNCGSVNFAIHAGVAPTLWRDRGNISLLSCNALAIPGATSSIVDLNLGNNNDGSPKFRKFFKTPWYIGGQIGYAVTNNFEFYLEVNYRQASARDFIRENVVVPNEGPNGARVDLRFGNKYRVVDAYVGARYYWGRCWCEQVAVFLGGKFGLVHRKELDFNLRIDSSCKASAPLILAGCNPFSHRNTSPAVGLNLGIDWCVGCGWSVILMGEVVAACGPRGNTIPIPNNCSQLPSLLPSALIIGHVGTELFFPVTLGFKYSF